MRHEDVPVPGTGTFPRGAAPFRRGVTVSYPCLAPVRVPNSGVTRSSELLGHVVRAWPRAHLPSIGRTRCGLSRGLCQRRRGASLFPGLTRTIAADGSVAIAL